MSHFDQVLARLKRGLGLRRDQEIAAFLGMTKAAFSARKTRGGTFPEEELRRALKERPAPGLDVDWVLTGGARSVDRSAAVEMVKSRRGVYAPTLDMPYLLKIVEKVQELAEGRGVQLDDADLGAIAGGVYNVLPVGAPMNEALIYALLELKARTKD